MISEYHTYLSSAEEIIDEARQGRMFILVDDEDRENEGDLVIPAQMATPEAVNFMARFGRGLICLAMERERIERLRLPLMAQQNASRHHTAFTVSIEAREGVTTGISAADRARTIQVATDPRGGPDAIVTPGHIFPLLARDGGVLVRAGHTEASVDIARLAGLTPAGVICEIMNDDGTMARMPDLVAFAQLHGLKVGTIADLIAYRRRTETIIERRLCGALDSRYGGRFQLYVYVNKVAYAEHIALVRGDISGDEPVLVRMHALSLLDDVLGDLSAGRDGELHACMELIARVNRGVIVLLRDPRTNRLSATAQARLESDGNPVPELRDYGVGAQILLDLGIRRMTLLSNRRKSIIGLEGYGLSVEGHRPIPLPGDTGGAVDRSAAVDTGTADKGAEVG
jgi:3,4-dihydroxy 2-butanone 4-phosphate synthase/GTP cyclohydrolase II